MGKLWKITAAATVVGIAIAGRKYGIDKTTAINTIHQYSQKLGPWAIPSYIAIHTITLCLCLPHAVLFEAAASLVFGFRRGLACVFAAKLLAASASFLAARVVLRRWPWAMEKARGNKYFDVVWRGVERDGWKFVLLARFSPVPSYVINYALAATEVRFLRDFLAPTAVGCLPMIVQNASIGSLAAGAASSSSSSVSSYVFPVLGILSSVLISWRIKSYSAHSHSM